MAEEKKVEKKSQPKQAPAPSQEPKKGSGMSTGLIIGCCIGAFVLFLIILGVAGCTYFSIAKPGTGIHYDVPTGEPDF